MQSIDEACSFVEVHELTLRRSKTHLVMELFRKEDEPTLRRIKTHLGMELFGRRRCTNGSAQQSNMIPCMFGKMFPVCQIHHSLPLGPIQP